MFRTDQDVHDPERRTFDNVRRTLEPTLYALHYERVFESSPKTVFAGTVYPIPYYFDAKNNVKRKAWHKGNLVIDHMTLGHQRIVTVAVGVCKVGQSPVLLSTIVCNLGGAAPPPFILKRFQDELFNVDLTPYDGIGVGYDMDVGAITEFHFSTTLIWRPAHEPRR